MRKRNNNRGFSLIEVLVAVAILAVVALPILRVFNSSAMVNSKARKEENANTAASAVVEEFKSLSLEQLREKYEYTANEDGSYTFTVTSGDRDYYGGINGEEFQIQVTLDPAAYTDEVPGSEEETTNNPKNNINSFEMPKFTSLNDSSNFVIREQIHQWDTDARETFRMQSGETDIVKVAADMSKTVDLTVSIELKSLDGEQKAIFVQTISGTVTYRYKDYPDYVRTFVREAELKEHIPVDSRGKYVVSTENSLKNIYIFYTVYDIYSNTNVQDVNNPIATIPNAHYATDVLSINYVYDNDPRIEYEDLNLYLVQQDVSAYDDAADKMYVNRDNVSLSVGGRAIAKADEGTIDLSAVSGNSGPVNFYSNIYGWNKYRSADTGRNNGLTVNTQSGGDGWLYTMAVDIWLDGELLVSVTSTKEN